MALEQALLATWVDEVFETNRQRQYPRALMFSTLVALMTLVTLGLHPSVHVAARKRDKLPVSMAVLPGYSLVVYDPDTGLVCDIVPCEDAHESERVGVSRACSSPCPTSVDPLHERQTQRPWLTPCCVWGAESCPSKLPPVNAGLSLSSPRATLTAALPEPRSRPLVC